MTKNVDVIHYFKYVKRYTFQGFAELLHISEVRSTNWMKGFYFQLGEALQPTRIDDNTMFIFYQGLVYSKGRYYPYIVIPSEDKFEAEHKKTVDKKDQSIYWIKVDRVEPYELKPIREPILDAILETEKARKESKEKSKTK